MGAFDWLVVTCAVNVTLLPCWIEVFDDVTEVEVAHNAAIAMGLEVDVA